MNDLTKEELQEIKRSLKYMIKGVTTPYSCLTIELNNKLQFLIDNHQCTHKSDGMFYTSNPPQNKCIKCGEFYR